MTREEAIELCHAIDQYLCAGNPIWDTGQMHDSMNMAIEALKAEQDMESAYAHGYTEAEAKFHEWKMTHMQKWIPCSKKLPKPNSWERDGYHYDAYLVTNGHMMFTARYDGTYWILWGEGGTILNYIKAWMPLPEPYQEEQE